MSDEPIQETPAPTPEVEAVPEPETTEPTQDAPVNEDADGTADAESQDAPEEYSDFSLPEDFVADEEQMSEFKDIAKDMNLSQENAQKLVDFYAKAVDDAAAASAQAWEDTTTQWATDAKNDKEFGGQNFEANIGVAKEALDYFGDDEFKQMLDMTGVGNHPAMFRFAAKLGKAMKEDKIVLGHSKDAAPLTQADRLFPSMRK